MHKTENPIQRPIPRNNNQPPQIFTFPLVPSESNSIQTPISVSNNPFFRLNASQFESSSTPGISNSQPKGEIILFQEYQDNNRMGRQGTLGGKKKLTIKIQDQHESDEDQTYQLRNQNQKPKLSLSKARNLTLKIDEDEDQIQHQNFRPCENQYYEFSKKGQSSSLSHSQSNSRYNSSRSKDPQLSSQNFLGTLSLTNQQNLLFSHHANPLKIHASVSPSSNSSPSQQPSESPAQPSIQSSRQPSPSQIQKLTTRVLQVQQKLFYYEDYNKKLLRENQTKEATIEDNQREIRKLNGAMRRKDEALEEMRERVEVLMGKIAELEKERDREQQEKREKEQEKKENHDKIGNYKALQTKLQKQQIKLKQKDTQLKQLQKKTQKILSINKVLQRQLRQSEKKVIQLQKQMHRTTCNNFYENVTRLKESSMKLRDSSKENHHMNASTGQSQNHQQNQNYGRKSLEVKKNTTNNHMYGAGKSQRTNSSNVNLLAKKLAHGK